MPSSTLTFFSLGQVPFSEGRVIQERLLAKRRHNLCSDTILFCEHPPTLSLGKRTKQEDIWISDKFLQEKGIYKVVTDRGGGPTYHCPGQLLIYPVISLREKKIGVKDFVNAGLSAIQAVLQNLGVESVVSLKHAGVWIPEHKATHDIPGKKIAAVGLRIIKGISNHGFSFNITGDYSACDHFASCGYPQLEVTSLQKVFGNTEKEVTIEMVAEKCQEAFEKKLG